MKIWLVSRKEGGGYDEYDAFVVVAETAEAARLTHPNEDEDVGSVLYATTKWDGRKWMSTYRDGEQHESHDWPVEPDSLIVTEIGTANDGQESGVVLASFNAG